MDEPALYALNTELVRLRTLVEDARDVFSDVRGYALSVKGLIDDLVTLVTATRPVAIQNLPAPLPVSGTVSIGNLPNPLPVSLPGVSATNAFASLTSSGDLVAAQAGVTVRVMAAVLGATTAVTLSVRSGAVDLLPVRIAANGTVVLPWNDAGWCVTAAGAALRVAFAGSNTVTAFVQYRTE